MDWIDRAIELRKKEQLTQLELADKMNLTQSYVSGIENRRKGYKLDTVYRFAEALNVSFDKLYYGSESADHSRYEIPMLAQEMISEWLSSDNLNAGSYENTVICPLLNRSTKTYAYRVDGDAMSPIYRNSSVVYIDPSVPPLPGANVLYTDNGKLMLRSLASVDGTLYLKPINPQYPAVELSDDATFLGTVIASFSQE